MTVWYESPHLHSWCRSRRSGIIIIKALKRIQEADYILHDALVSDEILNLAKPEAQRIYVGKLYQDGQDQTGRQEWINQLIIDLAAKGQK